MFLHLTLRRLSKNSEFKQSKREVCQSSTFMSFLFLKLKKNFIIIKVQCCVSFKHTTK